MFGFFLVDMPCLHAQYRFTMIFSIKIKKTNTLTAHLEVRKLSQSISVHHKVSYVGVFSPVFERKADTRHRNLTYLVCILSK